MRNSIVLGKGRSLVSVSEMITAPGSTELIAFPVPCPSPVYARDPYSVTSTRSRSGYLLFISIAAL